VWAERSRKEWISSAAPTPMRNSKIKRSEICRLPVGPGPWAGCGTPACELPAPSGGASPRRCAARSTVRKTAPPPARPASSPKQCVPGRREAVARTTPQGRLRATRRAPDTHTQIDASVRWRRPSRAIGTVRCCCHHQKARLVAAGFSGRLPLARKCSARAMG
jgi:hypothetical protein